MLDAQAAEWEFAIPVDIEAGDETHQAIITNLYDRQGDETWRPEHACVAVGIYLTGPRAGQWIVIDDITEAELKPYVH
jgi:hypothetical protein